MSQEKQLNPQVETYDPAKHDTAPVQEVVGCPYTRTTMLVSEANGCGKRCQHFQALVPVMANKQVPKDGNGKPAVVQVRVGTKVACNFTTLRDVVPVHAVVNVPMPQGVVPFPGQPSPAPVAADPAAEPPAQPQAEG